MTPQLDFKKRSWINLKTTYADQLVWSPLDAESSWGSGRHKPVLGRRDSALGTQIMITTDHHHLATLQLARLSQQFCFSFSSRPFLIMSSETWRRMNSEISGWKLSWPNPVAARCKAWVWDCGFESRRQHWCLSLVSVVYCRVEVSASGRSLVQRSPTDYVYVLASLSVIKFRDNTLHLQLVGKKRSE